jgi:hypothetical protein
VDRRVRAAALLLAWAALCIGGAARADDLQPGQWVPGVQAWTDANRYDADQPKPDGQLGEATLRNSLDRPVYLPGCSPLTLEREASPGQWESPGPTVTCVWEGFAQRVDAGAEATFPFTVAGGGTWRVRFAGLSIGCQDGKALSQAACTASTDEVVTPPFVVQAAGFTGRITGEPAMEPGVDRPGGDYANFALPVPEPRLCRAACEADASCAAWTYVNPGVQGDTAQCWLKSSASSPVRRDCCISGVKTASGQVPTPQQECEAKGGTWERGGLSPQPLCFYPTPDADKPCDRADQCLGHCLLPDTGASSSGMRGQCSRVEPMFGCFKFLDDQGREAGICID